MEVWKIVLIILAIIIACVLGYFGYKYYKRAHFVGGAGFKKFEIKEGVIYNLYIESSLDNENIKKLLSEQDNNVIFEIVNVGGNEYLNISNISESVINNLEPNLFKRYINIIKDKLNEEKIRTSRSTRGKINPKLQQNVAGIFDNNSSNQQSINQPGKLKNVDEKHSALVKLFGRPRNPSPSQPGPSNNRPPLPPPGPSNNKNIEINKQIQILQQKLNQLENETRKICPEHNNIDECIKDLLKF